jgi:glycosyltransferase involved in cell wall biosynthesis
MKKAEKIAIIGGRVCRKDNRVYAHVSFGKILQAFAKHYQYVYLSAPLKRNPSSEEDFLLPENITLVAQPDWKTTIDSLRYISKIKKSYKKVIHEADHVFVRGNPVAATTSLYRYCAHYKKPICHWLVGNPMVLLKSHKRDNNIKDMIAKFYIWLWERQLLRGRLKTNGCLLCNGKEIAERYPTSKTYSIVSTTLTSSDFFKREDTCAKNIITLLCLCYVRPEKGIEYLIEAIPKLKVNKQIRLIIAGSRDRYQKYQIKLDNLAHKNHLTKTIKWLGHVKYKNIPNLMRDSDILVLPTLSEGTPRVLVEARANSLPVISTNVGGIPSSVESGYDGILVPPKDSQSLADAILKIIVHNDFRKHLINNGYEKAKEMTIDKFVDKVINCFNHNINPAIK